MADPKPEVREIETRLKSIIEYVQDCEHRVSKGEVMDLQGLDDNVVEICDAITALPRRESRELEPKMSRLIEMLEVLARAMKAQQDKITAAGAR